MEEFYVPVFAEETPLKNGDVLLEGGQVGTVRVDEWRDENQYDALDVKMETIKRNIATLKEAKEAVRKQFKER